MCRTPEVFWLSEALIMAIQPDCLSAGAFHGRWESSQAVLARHL